MASALDDVYRSMGDNFGKLLETYSTAELEFLAKFYQATIDLTRMEIGKLKVESRGGQRP